MDLRYEGKTITDDIIAKIPVDSTYPKTLTLQDCAITDRAVGDIVRFINLRVLVFKQCRNITIASHIMLSKLTNLRHLVLSTTVPVIDAMDDGKGVPVTEESVGTIRAMMGDINFYYLSPLKHLRHVDTGPYLALTPAALKVLAGLPKLQDLRIQQSQLLTTRSMEVLGQMTNLMRLSLLCSTSANLDHLSLLTNLSSLMHLELGKGTQPINDRNLVDLMQLPALVRLDIRGRHQIATGPLGITRQDKLVWLKNTTQQSDQQRGTIWEKWSADWTLRPDK